MTITELEAECERLRTLAHEAPLAKIYEDHKGRRSIGVPTSAWSDTSRNYMNALEQLRKAKCTQAKT